MAEQSTAGVASTDAAEAAQVAFAEGDEFFDVQRYEEAIAAYRRSHALVASPNSRLMIARSLQEVGRLDEAYQEYVATVRDAETLARAHEGYEPTAAAARHELEALKSRVAWLTIELGDVPSDSGIVVGGKRAPASALSEAFVVVPGRVDVVATAPDGRIARAQVHLAAGRERKVTLKLDESISVGEVPPLETTESGSSAAPATEAAGRVDAVGGRPRHRGVAWVATAVGVAGFAGFGILGQQSRAQFEDLESSCPDDVCPSSFAGDIERGQQLQRLANVGLAVGVVGIGTGVTLFVAGRRGGRESSRTALMVGPGTLSVAGRWP